MWPLVSVAPYATVLGLVGFMYFVIGPFVGYIRDPKGKLLCCDSI